jgi:hypothetical protein
MRLNPANENVIASFSEFVDSLSASYGVRCFDRERRQRCHGRLDVEKCGHWRAKYANTSELRPQKQRRSIVKRQPAGHLLKPNSRVTGSTPGSHFGDGQDGRRPRRPDCPWTNRRTDNAKKADRHKRVEAPSLLGDRLHCLAMQMPSKDGKPGTTRRGDGSRRFMGAPGFRTPSATLPY